MFNAFDTFFFKLALTSAGSIRFPPPRFSLMWNNFIYFHSFGSFIHAYYEFQFFHLPSPSFISFPLLLNPFFPTHPPPTFMSFCLCAPTEFNQGFLHDHGWEAIYWSMGNLSSITIPLKKVTLLPKPPLIGNSPLWDWSFMSPSPFHDEMLMVLPNLVQVLGR